MVYRFLMKKNFGLPTLLDCSNGIIPCFLLPQGPSIYPTLCMLIHPTAPHTMLCPPAQPLCPNMDLQRKTTVCLTVTAMLEASDRTWQKEQQHMARGESPGAIALLCLSMNVSLQLLSNEGSSVKLPVVVLFVCLFACFYRLYVQVF